MEEKPSHGKLREEKKTFQVPDWAKEEKVEIGPIGKEREILYKLEEEMRMVEDQLLPKGLEPITLPDGIKNIDEYEEKLGKRYTELKKLIPLQEEKIRNMERLANNTSEN